MCTNCSSKDKAKSKDDGGHYHRNNQGILVRCYHQCRNSLLSVSFWLGVTLSFPLEHVLWEKVWPFKALAVWMGL